jgi:NADPH-dependent ferric siderophore reductase
MSVLDRLFLSGTVLEVELVSRRVRRVRIVGEALRDLDWVPGQHVRLRVGDLLSPQVWLRGFRDALRTYSVWDYAARGDLDLCVLDHEEAGPGALWARRARGGLPVALTRPEGRFVVRDGSPYHLFVGDETASVAFGAMLRGLPETIPVAGVIVAAPGDRLPLPRSGELTWTCRDVGTDAEVLVRALRQLDLPSRPGTAYVAGEARACQAVRAHLVRERGWPRATVRVKAFWAPGRRGLD